MTGTHLQIVIKAINIQSVLKKKFNPLQETCESYYPNNKYKTFVTALTEAAAKCI